MTLGIHFKGNDYNKNNSITANHFQERTNAKH